MGQLVGDMGSKGIIREFKGGMRQLHEIMVLLQGSMRVWRELWGIKMG